MGTREEAEVSKTARVVGEVSLNKQTNEREQTVRDTVRRTEVEVEEPEPSSRKPG
jgi:stress response protein YsnF